MAATPAASAAAAAALAQAERRQQHEHEQEEEEAHADGEDQMYEDEGEEEGYDEHDEEQDGSDRSQLSSLPIVAGDVGVDNSAVYAAFGRDTAAGRRLFNLYNKNKTAYTPQVTVKPRPGGPTDPRAEAEAARLRAAAATAPRKYHPPTRLKKSTQEREVGYVGRGGGKKTSAQIDAENARDAHMLKAPVVPAKMLQAQSREAKTRALQDGMEGKSAQSARGGAPLRVRPGASAAAPAPARKDPTRALADAIVDEIDERHQFLDRMRARGDLTLEQEAVVKGEIAERLREMKQLEKIMAEEEEERAGRGGAGAGAGAGAGRAAAAASTASRGR